MNDRITPQAHSVPQPFATQPGAGSWNYCLPNLISSTSLPDLSADTQRLADQADTALLETAELAARFHRITLFAEALASSQIESIYSNFRMVAAHTLKGIQGNEPTRLVANNLRVMELGLDGDQESLLSMLSNQGLITIQSMICGGTNTLTGSTRGLENQVYVGGGSGIHNAVYIPPRADHIPALLDDMWQFAGGRTDIGLIARTAITHAQFESIHPFTDGNGRTGRTIMAAMLATGPAGIIVPFSIGLLARQQDYYQTLQDFRHGDWEPVIALVADAVIAGCRFLEEYDRLCAQVAENAIEQCPEAAKHPEAVRAAAEFSIFLERTFIDETGLELDDALCLLGELSEAGLVSELAHSQTEIPDVIWEMTGTARNITVATMRCLSG